MKIENLKYNIKEMTQKFVFAKVNWPVATLSLITITAALAIFPAKKDVNDKENFKHILNVNNNEITVREIVDSIYGDEIEVDDNFVNAYIKTINSNRDYNSNSVITNRQELFELTEWIPTIEEVQSNYSVDMHF